MSDSVTPWTASRQASLSITISQSLLKLMSIESMMPSNHLILCRPRLLPPSIFPSISVFSNDLALHIRWPKYWNFGISPSNDYSGLISCRIDWLALLAVQGTPKSLLQNHSSKASILQHSAFCIVQLSHPYMTIGKTIALTRRTFLSKVMSLLFNMLSMFVIDFLPRSKHLLISRLQSPSAVTLTPPNKICHCFHSPHLFALLSSNRDSCPGESIPLVVSRGRAWPLGRKQFFSAQGWEPNRRQPCCSPEAVRVTVIWNTTERIRRGRRKLRPHMPRPRAVA